MLLPNGDRSLLLTCSCCPVVFEEYFPHDRVTIISNLGNIVPPFLEGVPSEIAAAIEYGVAFDNIRRAIICGHTDCDVLRSLLSPLPVIQGLLKKWLENAPQLHRAAADTDLSIELERLVEANVLLQMRHLMSYSMPSQNSSGDSFKVEGWILQESLGLIAQYDSDKKQFLLNPSQKFLPPKRGSLSH